MLFNSLEFLIFLPIVFCLYWFIFQKNLRVQNLLLLISSYFFYGWWDYRFLSLIFLSTVVDYFVGLKIHNSTDKRIKKSYLWLSILFNLGLLGFFKYFNFFIDSWVDVLGSIGYVQKSTWTLNVILPVGISFYTFQTMSYSLDIYHGKLKPTKDFISFASFVSFFPQLVAGPIERASNLLPQFSKKRIFNDNDMIDASSIILKGLFKKIVVADSLAVWVDVVFSNFADKSSFTLISAAVFFSFQIYCDFSGYSLIAKGVAQLFGFKIMENFNRPYLSLNIKEFWNRWHISLSTWFRDYVFIPLGGSKVNKLISIRNIFITFILSGFWHGANWTFLFWGFLHAAFYIPLYLKKNFLIFKNINNSVLLINIRRLSLFLSVTIGWIFFRSDSVADGARYIMLIAQNFMVPFSRLEHFIYLGIFQYLINILLIISIFILYLFPKNLAFKRKMNNLYFNISLTILIIIFGKIQNGTFIYFQF